MTNIITEIDPVGQRIAAIIKHYGLNKNSFSKMIGLNDNSLISRIVSDPRRGMSLELIQKIANAFPDINIRWLVLNEGEILSSTDFPDPKLHYIKYYRVDKNEPVDHLRIYGYDDCDFAFDVYGDIMSPKYRAGDIVLCKEIKHPSVVRFGEAYLIIAHDEPYIRYIKAEIENGYKVGAESPRHEDSIMAKSEIEKLYIIKGVIRRETF